MARHELRGKLAVVRGSKESAWYTPEQESRLTMGASTNLGRLGVVNGTLLGLESVAQAGRGLCLAA